MTLRLLPYLGYFFKLWLIMLLWTWECIHLLELVSWVFWANTWKWNRWIRGQFNFLLLIGIYKNWVIVIAYTNGTIGKESASQCRRFKRWGSVPGLGRFLGVRNGNTLQYSCLEHSMDRGAGQELKRFMEAQRVRPDWVSEHSHANLQSYQGGLPFPHIHPNICCLWCLWW